MAQFSLVTYNIQAFTEERAVQNNLQLLKQQADILCLQEVTSSKGIQIVPGSGKRLDLRGSDHYPLLMELEL